MTQESEGAIPEEINFEEQYGVLSEECKKLKIDISSLQLSNRSLVNQNRDEKKKVMDCRLQIAELESRLKSFESTKQELSDCQAQCERVRMTLESSEAKLADAERRADEANGLIKIKDSVILKQSNFTKEIEERLRNVTEERDSLLIKSANLETDLNAAIIRGEDADELREKLKNLEELFDKLVSEKSECTSESGLAAANEYFKAEQTKCESKIAKLKEIKSELEQTIERQEQDKRELLEQMDRQMDDYEKLSDKCATLEARIKEMAHSERRYGGGMMGSRLIGPTMPPWINDDKKMEDDLERLSKADPATLRAKVMELESQLTELNQLLTYREDVILRIHEEIGKKASKLEAAEVERSSLNAQVSILKRELATAREDLSRRGLGPADLEAEVERLRGKRDREYQRRKRIEAELDEIEKENQELKQRMKRLEEAVANIPPPKPAAPQSDPSDRNRIIELQGTVNQLRMDNEAKRSELFDLRSRFDAKSAQMDKIAAELKTKERSTGELSTQLNSVRTQLESTTKELETLRCRAVRGGAEVERWHADLTSLQVTNKFLSTQLNEMRSQMIVKERLIANLTKRVQETLSISQPSDEILVNGTLEDSMSPSDEDRNMCDSEEPVKLESKLPLKESHLNLALSDALGSVKTLEKMKAELEAQLKAKEIQISELLMEVNKAREAAVRTKPEREGKLTQTEEAVIQVSVDATNSQDVAVQNTSESDDREKHLNALLTESVEAQQSLENEKRKLEVQFVQREKELSLLIQQATEERQLLEEAKLEMETRLMQKEKEITKLTEQVRKMCQSIEEDKTKTELDDKERRLTTLLQEATEARQCAEKDKLRLEEKLADTEMKLAKSLEETECVRQVTEKDRLELNSRLSSSTLLATQLSEDVSRERSAVEVANTKVQQLTSQINELNANLSSTRTQLYEARSTQRKADSKASTPVSPPAKRTRRSAAGGTAKSGAPNPSECPTCVELRKQISELESDISEFGSREIALTSQVNELRQQIVDAETTATDLRRQLSTVHQEMMCMGV